MSEEALEAIREAADRRDRATLERQKAAADIRRLVREAHDAGVPITRIAREAGLSRQGVYDALEAGRPA